MVLCASAGVPPHVFWGLTLGEVAVVIEGEQKRRHAGLIDRIVAATRALGSAFGGGNALQGLVDSDTRELSMAEVRRMRLWRPDDG